MKTSRQTMLVLFFTAFLAVLLTSCGSSNSSSTVPATGSIGTGTGTGTGTLRVSLTDAPAGGFDAVNVTVRMVGVHQSSAAGMNTPGWANITLNPPQKINLLNLTNGVLETLGQTSLPAGHYTQLRLLLSANTGTIPSNSVVLTGTTEEIPLDTPSAVQSGLKLIHEFDVAPGQFVDLVLDFDALKSVVTRGKGNGTQPTYLLKPVIRVTPMLITGIEGFVEPSLGAFDVMVSAQQSSTVVRSTTPDPTTGKFFLSSLPSGTYDVVITAENHATAVIGGVPVPSPLTMSTTITSTSGAPISLPTSTVQMLSGIVTLSTPTSPDTVAYVTALQAFPSGPTVTVKSTSADLLTGDYSLMLPIGSPIFGTYGTGTLPIVFTPVDAIAGLYSAQASADGYATSQPVDVDLTVGDVVQDFSLSH